MRLLLLALAFFTCSYCIKVQLNVTSPFGDLGDNEAYQGWANAFTMVVSAGQFNVTSETRLLTFDFEFPGLSTIPDNVEFFLTIEQKGATLDTPSDSRLISGIFSAGKAVLNGLSIWGNNPFISVAGTFFLATPTSASTDDECNGIWFFDGVNDRPSLTLPPLPTGWRYEGWVVDISDPNNPVPTSTGTFSSPSGADSDGAGPYAGPLPGPSFPGQDFVNGTKNMSLCENYMAVISIEPFPDPDPAAPFFLKPLSAMIMNLTGGDNPQTFMAFPDILPSVEILVMSDTTEPVGAPVVTGPIAVAPQTLPPRAAVTPTAAPSSATHFFASVALLICTLFILA